MSSQSCDFKLAADLVADCDNASVGGIKNTGYILNYDDVDFESCVRDESNRFILQNLVLQTGKKAYRIYVPGKNPFTGTNSTMVAGNYRNKFTRTAGIVILDNGPDVVRDIIDPLANGKFIIVLENKFAGKDGKNTFQVYGFEQGLSATALVDDKFSEETDGGWSATLEESNAPSPAIFLYNNSVATTRAALQSLVTGSKV
jgi:hypothetical protein